MTTDDAEFTVAAKRQLPCGDLRREWGASLVFRECQQARPVWPAGPAGVMAC